MGNDDNTLTRVGEFGLIKRVTQRLPVHDDCLLGPGDDAAVVAASDRRVVACTDVLVEGRHFRRDWSSATDVGHRAAAANLADIVAMGARPTGLLVGMCLPGDLPVEWAEELADGLAAEADLVGVSVVGGDTVSSKELTIAVTALGDLQGRAPVTRSGARIGDIVAVSGRLGWSAAGYTILSRGFRSPGALVAAHRRPEVPYAAGPLAAALGATAMIDVSDGLLSDLGHIAESSHVSINVESKTLEITEAMANAAQAMGVDPLAWVLTGGEDHALAATFPPDVLLGGDWRIIGRVGVGRGVTVDGSAYEGSTGWDHFR
ncbi:thiamine-phosphate kinase [Stackebrandtia nassauensis]|uniref:Thiamine-monophosphate kinase n=1 Tax=Stackebrandtia nassauensis (strain DSM 44728 / CIP 108903 / NRRL B-16338 / NBRC 102104 / LLR-40K-21) TaxID=446470 RepID=D3Q0R9_STANL|nr:thiamine-phosphate kinase [Stackebrandtia nassauensis]ADD41805.1 thiamine-monophosphate kinase [Stackebrandtia nassauensis DSM 44728]